MWGINWNKAANNVTKNVNIIKWVGGVDTNWIEPSRILWQNSEKYADFTLELHQATEAAFAQACDSNMYRRYNNESHDGKSLKTRQLAYINAFRACYKSIKQSDTEMNQSAVFSGAFSYGVSRRWLPEKGKNNLKSPPGKPRKPKRSKAQMGSDAFAWRSLQEFFT